LRPGKKKGGGVGKTTSRKGRNIFHCCRRKKRKKAGTRTVEEGEKKMGWPKEDTPTEKKLDVLGSREKEEVRPTEEARKELV